MTGRTPWPLARRPSASGWIVTMTDLAFLVLAFFVVQFAMGTPRTTAWNGLTQALSHQLGPSLSPNRAPATAEFGALPEDTRPGIDTGYLEVLLTDAAMPALAPFGATLVAGRDALSLRLPPRPAGAQGGWGDTAARDALGVVGQALRFVANRVTVRTFVSAYAAEDGAQALGEGLAAAGTVADALVAGGYRRPIALRAGIGQVDGREMGGVLGLAIDIGAP